MGTAWAMAKNQTGGADSSGGLMGMLPMFAVMFIVLYFFIIRPQQKKQKDAKKMMEELKKGDRVATIGGMLGSVAGIKDDVVTLKVSETTKIDFRKSAIATVLEKGGTTES